MSIWRHKKGGLYKDLAQGIFKPTGVPVMIYEALKDNSVWVRDLDVFMDGRFECIEERQEPIFKFAHATLEKDLSTVAVWVNAHNKVVVDYLVDYVPPTYWD